MDLLRREYELIGIMEKNLIKYAVQRQIQCPICGDILDAETNCVLVSMNDKASCTCVNCFKDVASRKQFHPEVEIHSTENVELAYFDPAQIEIHYYGEKC